VADRRTFVDLFAGCGGLTLGFEQSGRFRSIFGVEIDQDAAETYSKNIGDHLHVGPIESLTAADFPKADVVVGGPPCQAFSLLNRDRVGSERRGLWRYYLDALEATDCDAFVMENVPELRRSPEYREFRHEAELLGFKVEDDELNAADYGVPQTRRRAIVIGVRGARPGWPLPDHSDPRLPTIGTRPWRTFAEAVTALPVQPDERNWHRSRSPRPESIVRYQAVPLNGGNRFQMQEALEACGQGHLVPPCWRRKPRGTTDVFGRLWWDRPAFTIRTEFYKPEKGRYLHPTEDRPITVREAARCMSFPDSFRFPEEQSMTSVGRQIGNSVPPLLAEHLAHAVHAALSGKQEHGLRAA
jgi:DNA (cytosine-5)-methyltransferase 1